MVHITKWSGFPEKQWDLSSILDDFFHEGFFVSPFHRGEGNRSWVPAVDVSEDAKGLQVTAELPGMEEKDIKISLEDGCLTISGEKKEERKEEKGNIYRHERRFGSFYRSIPIDESIKERDIKATFKDGVLRISLPKTEKIPARPIQIERE